MVALRGLTAFVLLNSVSGAIPPRNEGNAQEEVLRDIVNIPRNVARGVITDLAGVLTTSSTDYKTMPPGTYTETVSTGLVRIIIVSNPTPTTANKDNCPAYCDCTRIEDKNSDEYFQCITNAGCRPCREPGLTRSSSTAKPTTTCPVDCDCTGIKDKESEEYFQCVTNANCRSCRVGGPPN